MSVLVQVTPKTSSKRVRSFYGQTTPNRIYNAFEICTVGILGVRSFHHFAYSQYYWLLSKIKCNDDEDKVLSFERYYYRFALLYVTVYLVSRSKTKFIHMTYSVDPARILYRG